MGSLLSSTLGGRGSALGTDFSLAPSSEISHSPWHRAPVLCWSPQESLRWFEDRDLFLIFGGLVSPFAYETTSHYELQSWEAVGSIVRCFLAVNKQLIAL